jgi:hypothetical protein
LAQENLNRIFFMTDKPSNQALRAKLLESCIRIANCKRIVPELAASFSDLGLAGDTQGAVLLYLASPTRHFDNPVSIAIKGQSASGKSHLLRTVLSLLPDDAYVSFSGMSDKALVHFDGDLRHKHIVIQEFAGLQSDTGNKWLRMLLSERHIAYATSVAVPTGGWRTQVKHIAGPTGAFLTTTEGALHPEDESRLLSFTVDDSPEQTTRVLLSQANSFMGGTRKPDTIVDEWKALQQWVALGPKGVVIPFGPQLARLVWSNATRIKRDFQHVLSLIAAHALLHQLNRATDQQGRVVAQMEDYAEVYDLVGRLISDASEATVPDAVQEVVVAVTSITNTRPGHRDGTTQTAVADKLHLHKSSIHHSVKIAEEGGYLINEEPRRGKPHRLLPGEPMPGKKAVLPTPSELAAAIVQDAEVSGG